MCCEIREPLNEKEREPDIDTGLYVMARCIFYSCAFFTILLCQVDYSSFNSGFLLVYSATKQQVPNLFSIYFPFTALLINMTSQIHEKKD